MPDNPDLNLEARLWDRFYDLYVNEPMQKIVTDRLRPTGRNDPHGVAEAEATLITAYGMIERQMTDRRWAIGEQFTSPTVPPRPRSSTPNRCCHSLEAMSA